MLTFVSRVACSMMLIDRTMAALSVPRTAIDSWTRWTSVMMFCIARLIARLPVSCSDVARLRCFVVSRTVAACSPTLREVCDCCCVAAAVCCTIFVTSSIALVTAALPRACSPVARAISAMEFVERSISSWICDSTVSARAVRRTPSATRSAPIVICSDARPIERCTLPISVRISSLGEIADLIGDDAERFAAIAGLRGDDRRVERE